MLIKTIFVFVFYFGYSHYHVDQPELVEQGAGLITARLEPADLEGCGGPPPLRLRLWPELPELPGFELADRSTVIPGGAGSTFTRGLLFDISVACFSTWYIWSTSGHSGKRSKYKIHDGNKQYGYGLVLWYTEKELYKLHNTQSE